MAASKRAPCEHRELRMLAYVPGSTSRGEHASTHWCPDCGAVCFRKFDGRQMADTWLDPRHKR